MTLTFALIAVVTIAAAVAALSLRNLVHCALSLTVAFAGLAAAYVQLGAQFVGFAQVLVYVGAVAILIVFAILLTRGNELTSSGPIAPSPLAEPGAPNSAQARSAARNSHLSKTLGALATAGGVFVVLTGVILASQAAKSRDVATPTAPV